jgi:hypothetical protein
MAGFIGRLGSIESRLANVILAFSESEISYIGSGNVAISGSADSSLAISYEASGGITASGTADQYESNRWIARGGIEVSGTADQFISISYIGSGGLELSGTAMEVVSDFDVEGSGGISLSGTALYSFDIRYCSVTLTGIDGPGPVDLLGLPVEDEFRLFIDCFNKSSVGGTAEKQFVECIEMRYLNGAFLPARTICNQGLFILEDPVGAAAEMDNLSLLSLKVKAQSVPSSKEKITQNMDVLNDPKMLILKKYKNNSKQRSKKHNSKLESNKVNKAENLEVFKSENVEIEKLKKIEVFTSSKIREADQTSVDEKTNNKIETVSYNEKILKKSKNNSNRRSKRFNSRFERNKVEKIENIEVSNNDNLSALAKRIRDQARKKLEKQGV